MDVMELSDEGQRAAEVARKLTLLDSMHLQKSAWGRVTTSLIVNYYKRVSFACRADDGDIEPTNKESAVE